MNQRFAGLSARAAAALKAAGDYARDLRSTRVTPAHVTVALISNRTGVCHEAMARLGATPERVSRRINDELARQPRLGGEPRWDASVDTLIADAHRFARQLDEPLTRTHHLLLAVVDGTTGTARRVLQEAGVTRVGLEYMLRELGHLIEQEGPGSPAERDAAARGAASGGPSTPASPTSADRASTGRDAAGRPAAGRDGAPAPASAPADNPLEGLETLREFGRDLTELARDNQLGPVIGRLDELRRIMQVLGRRAKNNPILVGEPGVGKSAIVEGFAQRIAAGDVPASLANRRIVQLDVAALVAGTSLRGQFEDRIRKLVREVASTEGRVILYVDEIHNLVTTGSGGAGGGAANLLKPALARGEISIIGTTTPAEYRKYIESDKALERRFQDVRVAPPSREESVAILRGVRSRYEIHHGVRILDEALQAAVLLSDRYVLERNLPDKAIDLIDEAASVLRLEVESEPAAIGDLKQRLFQIEVDKGLIGNGAAEQRRREQLAEQAAALRAQLTDLEARLEREKASRARITELKAELDATEKLVERAQQDDDLGRAAELKYGVIKELERALDEANAQAAQIHDAGALLREDVTAEDVARVVASWTGVPVSRMLESERQKLLEIEPRLSARVIGQPQAVRAIAAAVRRSRAGVQPGKRPIGNFFFVGPTGVGKTELAKALAEFLFDSEDSLIRIDMSEYMEQSKVNTLIGAAYGYVDSDKGGILTEAVRRRPYSVVLFDEAEKAHPDVFNLLLQVLDEGRLTDSQGRLVDFTNTIIIMTSNVGARHILDLTGQVPYEQLDREVHNILRDHFKPEFLNRLDDTVVFNALDRDSMGRIADILIRGVVRLLAAQDVTLVFTPEAREHVIEVGYQPEYGARPLKRALLTEVQDPLAVLLLEGRFGPGDTVELRHEEGADHLTFHRLTDDAPEASPAS